MLGHVAQGILRALAVELVDGDEVGKIQHVDFFQLRCGAELRRHHIHADIYVRHNRGIALAYAGSFNDHQVESGHLAGGNHVRQRLRNLGACFARRQRAHENLDLALPRVDRIHADTVAQQCAAGFAARRVDGDQRDIQLIVLVQSYAAYQLIGKRGLAGATGAGNAEGRDLDGVGLLVQLLAQLCRYPVIFQRGNQLGQRPVFGHDIAILQAGKAAWRIGGKVHVASLYHRQYHADQTQALAVFRTENAADTVGVQVRNLIRHDNAAAAAEHLDVLAATLFQQVYHVLEVFDVATLVAGNGDTLRIFLQGGGDDLFDRAVVPKVDYLGAIGHQDASHDVDGGVMAIEQRGGGDEAHLVGRLVFGQFLGNRQVGHGVPRNNVSVVFLLFSGWQTPRWRILTQSLRYMTFT